MVLRLPSGSSSSPIQACERGLVNCTPPLLHETPAPNLRRSTRPPVRATGHTAVSRDAGLDLGDVPSQKFVARFGSSPPLAGGRERHGTRTTREMTEFVGTSRYQPVRRLGAGGMGIVYEVFDRERGEHVALKTLSRVDPSGIYDLKKEFRSLADVRHPNVVTLYEMVNDDDRWFFTMELVHGSPFTEHVARDALRARPEASNNGLTI